MEPAEATKKYVRTEKRDLPVFGSSYKPPNTSVRIAIVGAIVVAVLAYLFVLPAFKGPGSNAMIATANQVANLQTNGELTSDGLNQAIENGRSNSGCGWVYVFIVPASAVASAQPGATGGIGTSVPQDPETIIVNYIKATYKPDELAVATADQGKTIVVAAAWSCS